MVVGQTGTTATTVRSAGSGGGSEFPAKNPEIKFPGGNSQPKDEMSNGEDDEDDEDEDEEDQTIVVTGTYYLL